MPPRINTTQRLIDYRSQSGRAAIFALIVAVLAVLAFVAVWFLSRPAPPRPAAPPGVSTARPSGSAEVIRGDTSHGEIDSQSQADEHWVSRAVRQERGKPETVLEFQGLVETASSRPLAQATVRLLALQRISPLRGARWQLVRATSTNDHGAFTLALSRWTAFEFALEVTHPAFAAEFVEIPYATAILQRLAPIKLTRGLNLRGRVVRETDDTPIAGAVVVARPESAPGRPELPAVETTSGPNGGFLLERLAGNRVTLSATKAGFARAVVTNVQLSPTSTSQRTIFLPPAVSFQAEVVNERGVPLSGALVSVHSTGPLGTRLDQQTTDAQGRFRCEFLESGYYSMVIEHPDYQTHRTPRVHTGTQGVEFRLLRLASVSFALAELPEDFSATAEVVVFQATSDRALLLAREPFPAQIEGAALTLSGLSPGTYVVEIRLPGVAPLLSPKVKLFTGATTDGGTLRFRRGGTIVGQVGSTDGEPVVAMVALAPRYLSDLAQRRTVFSLQDRREVLTDQGGRFVLNGVAPGTRTLSIRGVAHATVTLPTVLVANEKTVDLGVIGVAAAGELAGVVNDPAGRPIAGAGISMNRAGERLELVTDQHGRFRQTGLAPGRYQVFVHAPSKPTGRELTESLVAGRRSTQLVTIAAGEVTEVEFTVE